MTNESTFAAVQSRYNRLPKAGQSWVRNLSAEAEAAGVGFSAKHTKSVRRFQLLVAVVQCAADDLGDEEVRNLLALIDPRIEQLGTVPLGHIIGSLNATEAAAFAGLATGRLAPTFDANGSHTLTERGGVSATSATRTVKVVGVSFVASYPDNLTRLYEVADAAEIEGERLVALLVRNPANPYDANAVEVHVPALGNMAMIGHVDRDNAARLAPRIDNGDRFLCGVAGVRIDPQHPDRPGIDIAVTRLLDKTLTSQSAA